MNIVDILFAKAPDLVSSRMPNILFGSTTTKPRKPSPLCPTTPPSTSPGNSKSSRITPERSASLDLRDDFPKREPRTTTYFKDFASPGSPKTLDSGWSCSPGMRVETDLDIPQPPVRRIYVVTNGGDQDTESLRDTDSGSVRREYDSSRDPPFYDLLRPGFTEPNLPRGWERRVDLRSGRVYYIDHNTRTTSFHPPPVEPQGNPDQRGPLPPWWEMKVLDDGRTIFVDHETQTTTLRDPRKSRVGEMPLAKFMRKALYLQRIMRHERLAGCFEINVRKSHVFEDSCIMISTAPVDDLRKSLSIRFDGVQPSHHVM